MIPGFSHGPDCFPEFHFLFLEFGPRQGVGGDIFQMFYTEGGVVPHFQSVPLAFKVQDVLFHVQEGCGIEAIIPPEEKQRGKDEA